MADEEFRHQRLASVYDALDPDRSDLDVYIRLIGELGGGRVLDVGCGTGSLALSLADHGYDVVGVDPAPASLVVARAKDVAQRVHWIDGDAAAAPDAGGYDLAVMTGNVAQAIADPASWFATLRAVRAALRPGGFLVLESRDPADRAWQRWNRKDTYAVTTIDGVGAVTTWTEVTSVDWPLVTFRSTWIFDSDGQTLTSSSTLRFRSRAEIESDLMQHGFSVQVRDAPDRPGREFVFVAQRDRTA